MTHTVSEWRVQTNLRRAGTIIKILSLSNTERIGFLGKKESHTLESIKMEFLLYDTRAANSFARSRENARTDFRASF